MEKGIELYKKRKFREALQYFKGISPKKTSDVSYYLGLCYTQLEQYDEALAHLDDVLSMSNDFTQIYQSRMVIGYLYASTGRYRPAEFEFHHLLDEGYESSKVYAALGYIYFNQGKIPASIKNLEEALALDPNNSTALNSLSFIMADEGIRLPLALKYVRRALAIRPQCPAYLDTLGWILFKNGEHRKALSILQRAHELAPDKSEIRVHFREVKQKIFAEGQA